VSSTTILKRLFSYESQLFWPELLFTTSHLFAYHKHRQTYKSITKRNQQKYSLFSMFHSSTNSSSNRSTDNGIQFKDVSKIDEYYWLVGVKDNGIIAVLCTDSVTVLRMDSYNQSSIMSGNEDYYHVEVRPPISSCANTNDRSTTNGSGNIETMIPLTRLLCTSDKHCWIVVVDELSAYGGSVDNFYTQRLCSINISDNHSVELMADTIGNVGVRNGGYKVDSSSGSLSSSEFIISVRDEMGTNIEYSVNDD